MVWVWVGWSGTRLRGSARRGLVLAALVSAIGLGCTTVPALPVPVPKILVPKPHTQLCGRDFTLPDGWRLPTAAEVDDAWRRDDPGRFAVAYGDLDGDGTPDQAQLVVRTDAPGYGVFVFLCGHDGSVHPHLVLHNQELEHLKVVGIKPVAPGLYRTACGKGDMDCYPGEPHEVQLRHEGLDYFNSDRVASLFYWSEATAKFRWVAITD